MQEKIAYFRKKTRKSCVLYEILRENILRIAKRKIICLFIFNKI